MPHLLRIIVALAGLALAFPAPGAAQEPPPEDLAPPPPPTAPADPEPPEPEGPTSITITVPPLPEEPKPAPKPAKAQPVAPAPARPAPVRRSTPRRETRVFEPVVESEPEVVESAAEPTPAAKPVRKAKPAKKKVQRPKPRVVAKAPTPLRRTIHDREPIGGVLAAQFTLGNGAEAGGIDKSLLLFAIVFAAFLGAVVGVVGAAPLLADRWPNVFEPVIDATERIVLASICLAGALTLVLTWALTLGPGA